VDPTHSSDYLNGELTGSIVGAIATRDSISPVRISGGSPPIPFFHNAGLEPNKSVIGNRHSLPLESLDTPLSGYFEAQAISTTKEQHRIPTIEEPAPSDRIHHAEGRDDYPKVSHLVISASNEQKPVLAQAHPSAPNFFQKIIDRIYSHSMQARGYHTEHIGTTRIWRK